MASAFYPSMVTPQTFVPPSQNLDQESEKDKRKRTRNPDNWKKEKRKRAILSGKAYVNTKGELVGPRAIGPDCNCKHKCFISVSEDHRSAIFNGFYSLKSYDEQNAYLYGLIRRYDIQRKRKPVSERRTCSYKYYVRLKGREVQVCKKAFANIHGISDKKIRTLCIKHEQNILFPRDNRGRHSNRPKKVTSELVTLIKHHILKMLSGPSGNNFIKKDKNQGPDVNISQLHKDFLRQYEPEALDDETAKVRKRFDAKVKSWLYFKVFHEEFNSMDFNTVKRKLSDLRKSLEPSGGSVHSAKKKTTKQTKSKAKPREVSPSLHIPRTDGLLSVQAQLTTPQASPTTVAPQMGYVGTQQPHFSQNLQLSMLSLQHLNGGSHTTPAAFPAAAASIQQQHHHHQQQQQHPLNLQATGAVSSAQVGEQSPSQPLSLNLHPVGSHMSSYYLCFSHVHNLISMPVSSPSCSTQPASGDQGGNFVHQSNMQQFSSSSSLPHSPFVSQTNLANPQQSNILQSYSSAQHSNLY